MRETLSRSLAMGRESHGHAEVCAVTRPARLPESLCTMGPVIYLKGCHKCALGILGRQDFCLVFGGLAEPFEERWAGFGLVGMVARGRAIAFEPRLKGGESWTVFRG